MSDTVYESFLENLIKGIVNNPDKVKVVKTLDERGVCLTLSVDPKDMGLVIGRQGDTAKAIRTLLRIVGIKNNARVGLVIEEPAGSENRRAERSQTKPAQGTVDMDKVVEDLKI